MVMEVADPIDAHVSMLRAQIAEGNETIASLLREREAELAYFDERIQIVRAKLARCEAVIARLTT